MKRRGFLAAVAVLFPSLAIAKPKPVVDDPVVDDRMLVDVLVLELKTLFPGWTWDKFHGQESTWQVTGFLGNRVLYQRIPKEARLLPKSRMAYHETFRRMIDSGSDQHYLKDLAIRQADLATNPPLIGGKQDRSFLDKMTADLARAHRKKHDDEILKAFDARDFKT